MVADLLRDVRFGPYSEAKESDYPPGPDLVVRAQSKQNNASNDPRVQSIRSNHRPTTLALPLRKGSGKHHIGLGVLINQLPVVPGHDLVRDVQAQPQAVAVGW